jgi:UDP-3-O-[3-hydroxymyristoyl] glucosamine N-acyltransferase
MGESRHTTVRVVSSADVDERAKIGAGTTVWHLAQIREDAEVGAGCVIGRGAYVGPGVIIGSNTKLQNYALVYEPARLGDGVFIGVVGKGGADGGGVQAADEAGGGAGQFAGAGGAGGEDLAAHRGVHHVASVLQFVLH